MAKELDTEWVEIVDQTGIDYLSNVYSGFQDSCIRDIYITTKEFVDESLTMHFNNNQSSSLLFQREFGPISVLEIKFEDIKQFNFKSFEETSNPVIYDAFLKIENGLFYWADRSDWEIGDNNSIWICGKRLFWRQRPEFIGNVIRVKEI